MATKVCSVPDKALILLGTLWFRAHAALSTKLRRTCTIGLSGLLGSRTSNSCNAGLPLGYWPHFVTAHLQSLLIDWI